MPKISLVIPVYNTEQYLEQCLDSVLAQTFTDFEVICVDDGSTDKSIEILSEYQKKDLRIKVVFEAHKGVGNARNVGLKMATGDFIQFLDSDDFFEPTMLEEMYNTAIKNDVEMIVCSAERVYENGEKLREIQETWPINPHIAIINKPFSWQDCHNTILQSFVPEPWIALYKRELFVKNNIQFTNIGSSNGASLGFKLRFLARKIFILNKKFINYRFRRENSITCQNIIHIGLNMIQQRIELKNFLQENRIFELLKEDWQADIKSRIRFVISNLKTKEEFHTVTNELKKLLNEEWDYYNELKCFVTADKILEQTKNKRVFFWGASLFLRRILNNLNLENSNILGIIDKNEALHGSTISGLKVYSPQILDTIKADSVLITVVNHSDTVRKSIKDFLKEKYPEIELLPDIFD